MYLPANEVGTPPSNVNNPPPQRDRAAQRVLATQRTVCLLRSRRRTFLLSFFTLSSTFGMSNMQSVINNLPQARTVYPSTAVISSWSPSLLGNFGRSFYPLKNGLTSAENYNKVSCSLLALSLNAMNKQSQETI